MGGGRRLRASALACSEVLKNFKVYSYVDKKNNHCLIRTEAWGDVARSRPNDLCSVTSSKECSNTLEHFYAQKCNACHPSFFPSNVSEKGTIYSRYLIGWHCYLFLLGKLLRSRLHGVCVWLARKKLRNKKEHESKFWQSIKFWKTKRCEWYLHAKGLLACCYWIAMHQLYLTHAVVLEDVSTYDFLVYVLRACPEMPCGHVKCALMAV